MSDKAKLNCVEKQDKRFRESISSRIGLKFGRLTVINVTNRKDRRRRLLWEFRCDCGSTIFKDYYRVKTNHLQSCGCLIEEKIKNSNFKILYDRYKNVALRRNYSFDLTPDDVKLITKQNCYYCNIEPQQKVTHKENKIPYIYNGIDRKDNKLGYSLSNCVTCCFICNAAKSHYFSCEEMKLLMDFRRKTLANTKDLWQDDREKFFNIMRKK